jgi:hypothetical protein
VTTEEEWQEAERLLEQRIRRDAAALLRFRQLAAAPPQPPEPSEPVDVERWASAFMADVKAVTSCELPPVKLPDPGPPDPWPGELEQARRCWRKHRDRVRWQFGRWRPCADHLEDLSHARAGGSP